MKFKGRGYYVRKTHRFLGLFLGVQFLLWTLGGLYFSWTDIDEIHGDHFRDKIHKVDHSTAALSPAAAIEANSALCVRSDVSKMRIVSVLGETYYAVACESGDAPSVILISAADARPRAAIGEADATAIATAAVRPGLKVEATELVTEQTVTRHHEYREKPLPAWAVRFSNADGLTAYVAASDGQVHALRTDSWRAFDFLWMLHTMDFAGRDNFNNYLLRAFSLLGILTVASGFLLYFVSSKTIRRLFLSR